MSSSFPAARWARVSAIAGAVAGGTLAAFFGLARPFSATPNAGAMWLGPLNDAASVVQFAALVPVARALRRRFATDPASGRPVLVVTDVATAAMAAFVGLQVLLLAGVVPFAVQAPFVTAATLVCLGWTVFTSRVGARTGLLPRPVVLVGTATGVLFLAGGAVLGMGALLPADTAVRPAVLGVGLAVGVLGWSGTIPWTFLLGNERAGLGAEPPLHVSTVASDPGSRS